MGLPKIYDRFKAIREAYDSVVNVAENALTNATNAVLMASNALTTANNAQSAADGAQGTADDGVAKAEAAQAAADAAQSTADTGVELATNAQNTAYSNRDRIISLERDAEWYAVCSTAAGTVEKEISVDSEYFGLLTGTKVCVRFENTNTATAPTLNVNNLGAVAIRYRNATISAETLAAGRSYEFVYDGAYWQLVGDVDTVLEISDNYETGSSSVAASTNAVKNLRDELEAAIESNADAASECCDAAMAAAEKAQSSADAAQSSANKAQSTADSNTSNVSSLTSRVSSIEGTIPLMPSADTISHLSIVQYFDGHTMHLWATLPEGGTWVWLVAGSILATTGGSYEGTRITKCDPYYSNDGHVIDQPNYECGIYYGVSAGGTVVIDDVQWAPNGYEYGDGTYSANYNMVHLNICWRIA